MDNSTNILEHTRFLDLPKDVERLWLIDLPSELCSPGISDLPQEIVNEIIIVVPLIDLFRVSTVNKLFQSLAYKRRISITTEEEYGDAAEKGDILSILGCSLPYLRDIFYSACVEGYIEIAQLMLSKCKCSVNYGLFLACECGYMDIVQFLINKGANAWNWCINGACRRGHTANQGARNAKHFSDIAQLMIEKGAVACDCGWKCQSNKLHICVILPIDNMII